jgi:hypothetical protein
MVRDNATTDNVLVSTLTNGLARGVMGKWILKERESPVKMRQCQ